MAYNLYQVQMARAWAERIDKENAQAERFWTEQAMKTIASHPQGGRAASNRSGAGSMAAQSAVPSGYTSKNAYFKDRLEKIETELQTERQHRLKVEEELMLLRSLPQAGCSSKPGTPR